MTVDMSFKDADIVIITASAPMPKESDDRLKMLEPSLKIIASIVNSVKKSGFNGIYVVISNPVDIMTYYTMKIALPHILLMVPCFPL